MSHAIALPVASVIKVEYSVITEALYIQSLRHRYFTCDLTSEEISMCRESYGVCVSVYYKILCFSGVSRNFI